MNSNLDYLIEHLIDDGCFLDVTDLDSDFGGATFCRDNLEARYRFEHKVNGSMIVIASCDESALIRAKEHLHSDAEIIIPSDEVQSTPPIIDEDTIQYNGITVGRFLTTNDEESFYNRKLVALDIWLSQHYNYDDLTKILSRPCKNIDIHGEGDGIVIRGPVFSKCTAKNICIENVSLSKETRESLPRTKKLTLNINDNMTGIPVMNTDYLGIEISCDEMKRDFYITGNVKISIKGISTGVHISTDAVTAIRAEGTTEDIDVHISGCSNLEGLIMYKVRLDIDEESQQYITKFNGSFEICKTFPRVKELITTCLQPTDDISNITKLALFMNDDTVYRDALLNAEHLESLCVLGSNNSEWNNLFIALLKKGNIRDINLPEGIDIDDYPSVVFISHNLKVMRHNELAMKRRKSLLNLS